MLGKYLIESLGRIPVEIDLASEYRYRNPIIQPGDLVVGSSQSGETADTLAALKEAKTRGTDTLAICNVLDSSIPRLCDATLYTHAGPEIGVASTKCFTAQMTAFYLLAIIGRRTGKLTPERLGDLINALLQVPVQMSEYLAQANDIRDVAETYKGTTSCSWAAG